MPTLSEGLSIAIIAAGFGLLGSALTLAAQMLRWNSGEKQVTKANAEKSESEAVTNYASAAATAVSTTQQLFRQITELRDELESNKKALIAKIEEQNSKIEEQAARIAKLEDEKIDLQLRVLELETENAQLRRRNKNHNHKGLATA